MHRSALMIALLACVVGCGASQKPTSARAASIPCPRPNADFHEFQLPSFAMADGVFADWLGNDIVVLHVGLKLHGQHVRVGESPPFHGAIYDMRARRWIDIPAPPVQLPQGPSVGYYMRVVGRRVVLLWYALAPSLGPDAGGLVYNPATRRWLQIPRDNAPPSNAFLTGPYRQTVVGDRWFFWSTATDAPGGWVLDTQKPQWISARTEGMPAQPNFFHLQALRNGRVLVPSAGPDDRAGLFDPIANRWTSTAFVGLREAYNSLADTRDGSSFAIASWQGIAGNPGQQRLNAWIVDAASQRVTSIAPVSTAPNPNAALVHYDGERIIYIDPQRLYRMSRATGQWNDDPLPFKDPITNSGTLREVCGRRLLLVHNDYWLLDLETLTWKPVQWPTQVPQGGHHRVLLGDDRMAILGSVSEKITPSDCPPGAPCVAPPQERLEDQRAFIVPLR